MELILLLVLVFFAFYVMKRKTKNFVELAKEKPKKRPPIYSFYTKKGRDIEPPQWLAERWEMADKGLNDQLLPKWYFDDITDRQELRLEEEGIEDAFAMTKGQASDIIGLHETADNEKDIEILKFFGLHQKRPSETYVDHHVSMIMADPENKAKWENRPADAIQKEFFRFSKHTARKEVSHKEANKLIKQLCRQDKQLADDWHYYEMILSDALELDFREIHGIRKPSIASLRKAIDNLRQQGLTLSQIYENDKELAKALGSTKK